MAEGGQGEPGSTEPSEPYWGLAATSRCPVTGASAGPAWLVVPASCPGVQGQTHGPQVFSWRALGSLQALGGLALEVPLTGEVSAPRLTVLLPLVEGWEAPPAAQGWGSFGKKAWSDDAGRSFGRGGHGSGGQRDPGETQAAGPHSSCHEHRPLQYFLQALRVAQAPPLQGPGLWTGPPGPGRLPGLLHQSPGPLPSCVQSARHSPHHRALVPVPQGHGPHAAPRSLAPGPLSAIPQPLSLPASALLGSPRPPRWPWSPLPLPPGGLR